MAETKEKKIEIKKLVLQIGEREITLTPAEAEKLHAALGELFSDKQAPALVIKETQLIPVAAPYPLYIPGPYYTPIWYWQGPTITCTTTGGGNNWTGPTSSSGTITFR
jgi:hypothetical protein